MAAQIPLNTFKTVTESLGTSNVTLYTAPPGVTTIVLMAQITNITSVPETVTVWTVNSTTFSTIELVKNFDVPSYDAVSVTVGKLVIPTGDQVIVQASANSSLKATFSILETSNE